LGEASEDTIDHVGKSCPFRGIAQRNAHQSPPQASAVPSTSHAGGKAKSAIQLHGVPGGPTASASCPFLGEAWDPKEEVEIKDITDGKR
jgi:hypothetical protein